MVESLDGKHLPEVILVMPRDAIVLHPLVDRVIIAEVVITQRFRCKMKFLRRVYIPRERALKGTSTKICVQRYNFVSMLTNALRSGVLSAVTQMGEFLHANAFRAKLLRNGLL